MSAAAQNAMRTFISQRMVETALLPHNSDIDFPTQA
jgi:hypothetical protein